mgnify:CR=1 FL=1
MTASILHLHPQYCPHDFAAILGNRVALTALREAIDAALRCSATNGFRAFGDDGEGYACVVGLFEDMVDVPLGYADPESQDDRELPEQVFEVAAHIDGVKL